MDSQKELCPVNKILFEKYGIQPNVEFVIDSQAFVISGNGTLSYSRGNGPSELSHSGWLALLINGELTPITTPLLTPEKKRTLTTLQELGYHYVAKNNAGTEVIAYTNIPTCGPFNWHKSNDNSGYALCRQVSSLGNLISDWQKVLDIDRTLKDGADTTIRLRGIER